MNHLKGLDFHQDHGGGYWRQPGNFRKNHTISHFTRSR